jgi:hypothetical protein
MGTGRLIALGVVVVLVLVSIIYRIVVVNSRARGAAVGRAAGPRPSPGASPVAEGLTPGDATLRLSRIWSGLLGGQGEAWNIAIDGTVVGEIGHQETVEVSVEPGHHTLRLGQGRHLSPERPFDVAEGEVVSFQCHAPRVGGTWLAAQFRSDLWITLRPA